MKNGYKALSLVLALILVAAAVTELLLWQKGYIVFQDPNAVTEQSLPPVTDGEGNALDMVNPVPMPKSLVFSRAGTGSEDIDLSSLQQVTVQASVTPSDALNPAVDWSVGFTDPDDSWAAGKEAAGFIAVTPTSDGSLTAKITCMKAFGAQILVTVTSRDNPEASASCTVDFEQKVLGYQFAFLREIDGGEAVEFFSPTQYSVEKAQLEASVKVTFDQPSNGEVSGQNNMVRLSSVYTKALSSTGYDRVYYVSIEPTESLKSAIASGMDASVVSNIPSYNTEEDPEVFENGSRLFEQQWADAITNGISQAENDLRAVLLGFEGVAYQIKLMTRPPQVSSSKVLATFDLSFDTTLLGSASTVQGVEIEPGAVEF